MSDIDDPERGQTYICDGCGRTVDRDVAPSPGEPATCADCWEAVA